MSSFLYWRTNGISCINSHYLIIASTPRRSERCSLRNKQGSHYCSACATPKDTVRISNNCRSTYFISLVDITAEFIARGGNFAEIAQCPVMALSVEFDVTGLLADKPGNCHFYGSPFSSTTDRASFAFPSIPFSSLVQQRFYCVGCLL